MSDDDLTAAQKIRDRALHMALDLEHELPSALMVQTDDVNVAAASEVSAGDAAVMNGRARLNEQATADRVLRHARLFAEYIRSGFDGGDLDSGELAALTREDGAS